MSIINAAKSLGIKENVIFRVVDVPSGKIVQEHVGHNTATNSMLTGIGHYLIGDGVLNQGSAMLGRYIPQYISLGTMGLITQLADSEGLPIGLGEAIPSADDDERYQALLDGLDTAAANLDAAKIAADNANCCAACESCPSYTSTPTKCPNKRIQLAYEEAKAQYDAALDAVLNYAGSDEPTRLSDYMAYRPGYGADGYDPNQNNNRKYSGLGPVFADRVSKTQTINCELISDSFPRAKISFRDIVPEIEAELPMTIDIVYSAMISTGALKQFRESNKDYLFITEAGLWGTDTWNDSGENGLLAGYRIAPSDSDYWYMSASRVPDTLAMTVSDSEIDIVPGDTSETILLKKKEYIAARNRKLLKRSIIKVGINQVVQVIWKIQLGSIDQLGGFDQSSDHKCPVLLFRLAKDATTDDPNDYICIMEYEDPDNPANTPKFNPNASNETTVITR